MSYYKVVVDYVACSIIKAGICNLRIKHEAVSVLKRPVIGQKVEDFSKACIQSRGAAEV